MIKEEPIKCFVPALALEHPNNSEDANLYLKLRFAVLRWYQKKDFFADISGSESIPGLTIKNYVLNREAMGYEVSGIIRSG